MLLLSIAITFFRSPLESLQLDKPILLWWRRFENRLEMICMLIKNSLAYNALRAQIVCLEGQGHTAAWAARL
jgi:hypothetical protein